MFTAGLLLQTQDLECPNVGSALPGGRVVGDVNCSGAVNAVDALFILRYAAALPNNLPPGCPPIGPP